MNSRVPLPISSAFSRRALALAGVCLLFSCDVWADKLLTSFESNEGYRDGSALAGQEGWKGTDTWKTRAQLAVSSEQAFEGTQSVLANNANGSYAFAQSPDLGKHGYNGLSFHLKHSDAEFAGENQPLTRWEIIYGNPGGGNYRIVLYLRFTTGKTFHIHLSSTNDALEGQVGSRNILGRSNFRLGEWNEFGMQFDFKAKELYLTVNGAAVSSLVRLHPENATAESRITGFRIATPAVPSNGISFFDAVKGLKDGVPSAKP